MIVVPLHAEKNKTFQTERTDTMKKLLLMIVVVMMATVVVKGQESLAGRVYYCGNLMKKELGDLKKDAKQLEKEAESEKKRRGEGPYGGNRCHRLKDDHQVHQRQDG